MEPADAVTAAPEVLRPSADRGEPRYERADDLVALHRHGQLAGVLAVRDDPAVQEEDLLGPVYRRVPGGELVVPTGRLFVRFAEGDRADDHREALRSAGFEVESVPTYAPQAAWAREVSGSIGAALHAAGRLAGLPGVRHVEPQLLGVRAAREEPEVAP